MNISIEQDWSDESIMVADHNQQVVRVVIVEDHPMTREGMQLFLQRNDDIEVVGVTDSGTEALRLVESLAPEVVLLDVRLPDLSGVDVARAIRRKFPTTAILVLTGYDDTENLRALSQAGVQGYLLKTATGEQIVSAIRAVAAGKTVMGIDIYRLQTLSSEAPADRFQVNLRSGAVPFTGRELEVLRLIVAGYRNSEIGEALGIAVKTVEFHVGHVLSKLGARSRADAIRIALQEGIVTLNEPDEDAPAG